ncbi:hypothetical protein [Magnetovibrio sp.]|uniref:hypothetical protein n=1 Tax=Magnetovibrio sp. TaxID=2024836 RepID=UPI002F9291F6
MDTWADQNAMKMAPAAAKVMAAIEISLIQPNGDFFLGNTGDVDIATISDE